MIIKRIFLSSTCDDLQDYRNAVYNAISGIKNLKCVRMEDFGPSESKSPERCEEEVKDCNIFLGIIGHHYGSIVEGKDISFTEFEYNIANQNRLILIIFIAPEDDKFLIPSCLLDTIFINREKQKNFRKRLFNDHSPDFKWHKPDELATKVIQAIHNIYISRKKRQPDPITSKEITEPFKHRDTLSEDRPQKEHIDE